MKLNNHWLKSASDILVLKYRSDHYTFTSSWRVKNYVNGTLCTWSGFEDEPVHTLTSVEFRGRIFKFDLPIVRSTVNLRISENKDCVVCTVTSGVNTSRVDSEDFV